MHFCALFDSALVNKQTKKDEYDELKLIDSVNDVVWAVNKANDCTTALSLPQSFTLQGTEGVLCIVLSDFPSEVF